MGLSFFGGEGGIFIIFFFKSEQINIVELANFGDSNWVVVVGVWLLRVW